MALEATFRNLSVSLDQVHEAFSTLDLMFGDKPSDRELALIDAMENSLLDTIGELYGAKKAALDARKSVGLQPDLNNALEFVATTTS